MILPVLKGESAAEVLEACEALKASIEARTYAGAALVCELDKRDIRGGEKRWGWVKKGVPLIIEIGPRDLAGGTAFVTTRYNGEKASCQLDTLAEHLPERLQAIQDALLQRALDFRAERTRVVDTLEAFEAQFAETGPGGFALCHWAGDKAEEERIAKQYKVTIRCIPVEAQVCGHEVKQPGTCPFTRKASQQRVVFARAY